MDEAGVSVRKGLGEEACSSGLRLWFEKLVRVLFVRLFLWSIEF